MSISILVSCNIAAVALFFYCYGAHRYPNVLTHSFPTRRSSHLAIKAAISSCRTCTNSNLSPARSSAPSRPFMPSPGYPKMRRTPHWSSEEHTSELQSLMRNSYADFCLKKKTHHLAIKLVENSRHHVSLQQLQPNTDYHLL